jgi:hypothetical protein
MVLNISLDVSMHHPLVTFLSPWENAKPQRNQIWQNQPVDERTVRHQCCWILTERQMTMSLFGNYSLKSRKQRTMVPQCHKEDITLHCLLMNIQPWHPGGCAIRYLTCSWLSGLIWPNRARLVYKLRMRKCVTAFWKGS